MTTDVQEAVFNAFTVVTLTLTPVTVTAISSFDRAPTIAAWSEPGGRVSLVQSSNYGSGYWASSVGEQLWDENSRTRFKALVRKRADGLATAADNSEFDQLQDARRKHDAKERGIDLAAEWERIWRERKVIESLKRYGTATAGYEEHRRPTAVRL